MNRAHEEAFSSQIDILLHVLNQLFALSVSNHVQMLMFTWLQAENPRIHVIRYKTSINCTWLEEVNITGHHLVLSLSLLVPLA